MTRPEELAEETLLTNLIEEAGELVQAATKLLRVFHGDTPVTEMEAREHLIEEMADVMLCIQILASADKLHIRIGKIINEKYHRWTNRINGLKEENVNTELVPGRIVCETCKYVRVHPADDPCYTCMYIGEDKWELNPKYRKEKQ